MENPDYIFISTMGKEEAARLYGQRASGGSLAALGRR